MSQLAYTNRQPKFFSVRRWLPHFQLDANNPLWNYELRRVLDADTLRTRTRRWFLWGFTLPALFWFVYQIHISAQPEDWQQQSTVFWFWQHLVILFWASLADKLILDFMAVIAGFRTSQHDFTSANWDLVMLTHLSSQKVISAKHSVSQIRVWRMMMISIGFRSGIITAGVLQIFITPILHEGIPKMDLDLEASLISLVFLTALMMLALAYILEPRWRVATLTAGSIAVSTRKMSSTFQVLAGLGVIVTFLIAQAVILFFSIWATIIVGGLFFNMSEYSPITIGFFYVFWIGVLIVIFYTAYRRLEKFWLKNARNRLIKQGANL